MAQGVPLKGRLAPQERKLQVMLAARNVSGMSRGGKWRERKTRRMGARSCRWSAPEKRPIRAQLATGASGRLFKRHSKKGQEENGRHMDTDGEGDVGGH